MRARWVFLSQIAPRVSFLSHPLTPTISDNAFQIGPGWATDVFCQFNASSRHPIDVPHRLQVFRQMWSATALALDFLKSYIIRSYESETNNLRQTQGGHSQLESYVYVSELCTIVKMFTHVGGWWWHSVNRIALIPFYPLYIKYLRL